MRTFATYIEYLLMTRHYCYVPGRGAYMLSDEPSRLGTQPTIGTDSHRLYEVAAPRRVVRFSPLHTHDDGMLANLLMEAEGMTFDEARRYIERQAPLLTDDFTDTASLDTDTDNFGFESLQLETWSDIEYRESRQQQLIEGTLRVGDHEGEDRPQAEVIAIPKYWVKRAAVACLIALFFFTNFIGLNVSGPAQMASVLSICMPKVSEQPSLPELSNPLLTEQVVPTDITTSADDLTSETSPAPKAQASIASGTTYYVVVASTVSEEEALRVCERYRHQGFPNVGIMANEGRYRLFIEVFTQWGEARSYLHTIRSTEQKFSNAWLLKVKDGSLSYIIKDIYNDNQLSMELSHPKQRTERDQG